MKQIKCDYFGKGERLYFNIQRLAEFESAVGKPIYNAIQQLSLSDIITAYEIGLRQYGRRSTQFYADRLQELFDSGEVELNDIMMPIVKAITGSGILGKKAYFMAFPEEKTPEDDAEIEAEEDEAVKN